MVAKVLLCNVTLRLRKWRKEASDDHLVRDMLMQSLTDCVHFFALGSSVAASVVVIAPSTKAARMDNVTSLIAVGVEGLSLWQNHVGRHCWRFMYCQTKIDVEIRTAQKPHKVSANSGRHA